MTEKRKKPAGLQKVLAVDAYLTDAFCNWTNRFLAFRSLRTHYKILEVSCHGIPWLCGWLAFIWIWDQPSLYQMQVNLFTGLLLDIIFVAVLKAFTRRRRPAANKADMFVTVGPDKFSFPSGHASRACFVAFFFIKLWPVHFILTLPLLAWCTAVCLSRLLLRRHHILDVLGGVLLGILEGLLIGWLWLSQETSAWAISYISDERLEGGSYHV
ncbi:polyisoprenoid diphosphate/phosphate phosphohydrolase PLPP6 [Anabrus simplex]|uniref:polyisoprenoid diphosphate/phosphate phosphohydrolase PLPP6 n=1 Tax=Anabrus simplex TaxID=316456 RepID=UPI0035A30AFC